MKRSLWLGVIAALLMIFGTTPLDQAGARPLSLNPTYGTVPSVAAGDGPVMVAACRLVRKSYPCYQNQQRCWLADKCVPWQVCRLTPRGKVCTTTRKCWKVRQCKLVRVRATCWRTYRVCN